MFRASLKTPPVWLEGLCDLSMWCTPNVQVPKNQVLGFGVIVISGAVLCKNMGITYSDPQGYMGSRICSRLSKSCLIRHVKCKNWKSYCPSFNIVIVVLLSLLLLSMLLFSYYPCYCFITIIAMILLVLLLVSLLRSGEWRSGS